MLLDCYVRCYHSYVCMSWGQQILSSWTDQWIACLHVHGIFKFQVRFRVEGYRLGRVIRSKEGCCLNETWNALYSHMHALGWR